MKAEFRRSHALLTCVLILASVLYSCAVVSIPSSGDSVEVDMYDDINLEYTVEKVDFYSHLQLNENLEEDVIMHDVLDNVVLFSSQYFDNPLATGRAKVNRIGMYSLLDGTSRYFKPQNIYLSDAILQDDSSFVYCGLDSVANQWSVIMVMDSKSTVLDTGLSHTNTPEFAKIGNEILYVYEKHSLLDGITKYEYGVNAIREGKVVQLIRFIKEYSSGTKIKESLLRSRLMVSGDNYALLIQRDGASVVEVFNGNTKVSSVVVQDKIYDIALMGDSIFCSLQDKASGKPIVRIMSLDGARSITKTGETSPYYRMRSIDGRVLLAVNMDFDIYVLEYTDDSVLRRALLVEEHKRQSVGFYVIDENQVLLHFPYASQRQERALYLLEILR